MNDFAREYGAGSTVVLISSDKDFQSSIFNAKSHGCRVELLYNPENCDPNFVKTADWSAPWLQFLQTELNRPDLTMSLRGKRNLFCAM